MIPLVFQPAWLVSCIVSVVYSLCVASAALSTPLISEFCPDNETLIADSDGDFSDWIEIHNPDSSPVDLGSYALTDSASSLQKWVFPAGVTLEPGGFLIVFASNKDRSIAGSELHTNFKLSAGGEYLALVSPAAAVLQEFAPEYPPLDEDESYGFIFSSEEFVVSGDTAETLVPSDGTLNADWSTTSFSPGAEWEAGTVGAGFGVDVPGIRVRHVFSTTPITNLAEADGALADPGSGIVKESTVVAPVVNFKHSAGQALFGDSANFPAAGGNNFVIQATGKMVIPASGDWTFGSNSDEGARLRIGGVDVILDDASMSRSTQSYGSLMLSAGTHDFEYTQFQSIGGSTAELFATRGVFALFDEDFRLVGDTAAGGLKVIGSPAGTTSGSIIGTDLAASMAGLYTSAYQRIPFDVIDPSALSSLALSMRYSDGFVAYVNGTEVVTVAAPDPAIWNSSALFSRPDPLALEIIDISSAIPLLSAGANNVLAIHGLSSALPDSAFAVIPELAGGSLVPGGTPVVFADPSPGTLNSGANAAGSVLATEFSPERGFYPDATVLTLPFDVTIGSGTPGATIYYTTDGSEPSEANGTLYTGPIAVSGTSTLRAVAAKEGFAPSEIGTHTYIVVDDVITQGETPPPGWPSTTPAEPIVPMGPPGQLYNYGMDPDIVNSTDPAVGGVPQVKAALAAIPTLAVSIPLDSLNDPTIGIYSNPTKRGSDWERAASLELIFPDGYTSPDGQTEGFQSGCGLRIRGGFSRTLENPKHSFRLFFREEYGASKLNYPLFGDEGTDSYDGIDLRTPQNYSWAFQHHLDNSFLRDVWARDTQRELGHPYTRSRYYHLYLNGIYWGIYQTQERAEADFAESYFGGDELDYDVVKSFGDVTDGNVDAYERLFTKWQAGLATDAAFFDILGRDANGDLDPANHEKLIDLENLMDYMILTYFSGDRDGPGSRFTGTRPNNYFGIFDRTDPDGFKFFEHDSEHSLGTGNFDMVSPFKASASPTPLLIDFNPHVLHQTLADTNLRYRTLFADRVEELTAPGAILHEDNAIALIDARAAEIDTAIIAHSARWGDASVDELTAPRTRTDWLDASDEIRDFIRGRAEEVKEQMRAVGWYPEVATPIFSQAGGYISSSEEIFLTDTTGEIYITLDGSDPRLDDGSIAPSATEFVGPTVDVDIIDAGAVWKYLDSTTAPVPGWETPTYDDSAWLSGPAPLGYGEGGLATTVGFNLDAMGLKNITTYFRATFDLTDAASISELTSQIRRDDGAVVYLNGTEVARSNMPSGVISFDTGASSVVSGSGERDFFPLTINLAALIDGENVLAIEVHQESGGSSDLGFDFQAEAVRSLIATPTFLSGPGEVRVTSRALLAGEWSTLTSELFFVDLTPADTSNLIVTEIHYNPAEPTPAEIAAGFTDKDEFEFLELYNPSTDYVHLRGVSLTDAISFTFDDASASIFVLAPGQRVVLVENIDAFRLRYGNTPIIAGEYRGALSNGGETLTAPGIFSFAYDDLSPWPETPDGAGDSLTYLGSGNPSDPANWRPSILPGGFPGEQDELTFARWAGIHGLAALPNEDTDKDGFSLFVEYALGGSPTTSDAEIGATISIDQTAISIGFNPEAQDVTLLLESSDDLLSGSYTNTGIQPTIVGGRLQFALPVGAEPRRFYRIRMDLL